MYPCVRAANDLAPVFEADVLEEGSLLLETLGFDVTTLTETECVEVLFKRLNDVRLCSGSRQTLLWSWFKAYCPKGSFQRRPLPALWRPTHGSACATLRVGWQLCAVLDTGKTLHGPTKSDAPYLTKTSARKLEG